MKSKFKDYKIGYKIFCIPEARYITYRDICDTNSEETLYILENGSEEETEILVKKLIWFLTTCKPFSEKKYIQLDFETVKDYV